MRKGANAMRMLALLLILFVSAAFSQRPFPRIEREPRLPNGKSRTAAILKDDHEKSKKDVAEIIELAKELQEEIEENEEFVIDIRSLRKVERIEKLSKNIKNRMKRLQ